MKTQKGRGGAGGWLRGYWGTALVAAMATAWTAPATAAAPTTVMFEGVLRSAGGTPAADGDYDLTFSLYDSPNAQAAVWSEQAKVKVVGGHFAHGLGSVVALDAAKLAGAGAANTIGVKVGSEPELPRQGLHNVAYAIHAASATVAGGIACTACVSVGALKFDENVDLGANALKAGTITASQLSAQAITGQTVTAASFVGDGSKLTGLKLPNGKCSDGKVVTGINADGTLACASTAAALPKDGLDEISNKMLTNQFVELFSMPANEKGLKIPDNNGLEAISTIIVPSVGISEEFFKVNVDVVNTDLSAVSIVLLPPDDKKTGYTLCDPCGAKGEKTLKTSFPVPTQPKTGDLSKWLGVNPAGSWVLKVKDTTYCIPQLDKENCDAINGTDGKINDWSITFQVLSSAKVQVNGDLLVAGKVLSASADIKAGPNNKACNAELAGTIRFQNNVFEGCDGTTWHPLHGRGSMYRWARWNVYEGNNGWWAGNNASLHGGIAPSNWSSAYRAYQMSSDSQILRNLFHRKGPDIGTVTEGIVVSEKPAYMGQGSNEAEFVAVIMRIKNSTGNAIDWTPHVYVSSYGGWSDRASIAVNGNNVWDSGGSNYYGSSGVAPAIQIPANRTSTVIFVSNTSPVMQYAQVLILAFYNNCLKLPNGLEFVDDLDTKPNGWDK